MDCKECPHALWAYEVYYGTNKRQWFVEGCRLGKTEEECEEDNDDTD